MSSEFVIIVSVNDRAGFVKVEGDKFIIQPDIQDCTKWERESSHAVEIVLDKVRKRFPNLSFVAVGVPKVVFGSKPRRVEKE